eukprot:CAMPEP_0114588806 /NCGR_PEP_ID=MMETSP0125-20121206/11423_1 /TAXON_ID=485358 ORGANISM="Aristerostoma sp., Strain ATCC 50986" /NCGR_SAMPLE_ID=MMETSP0125 /ASSEMBLY_ACC=CAM_ASM_000245 /LENGTH=338 /DNA_ID=CAMNT_0001785399 /DNA_START=9 /DNA_END=1025 /DNA_ORIENTATION=+
MSLADTIKKVSAGRKLDFKRDDIIFEKVIEKYGDSRVYDTQNRLKPVHSIPDDDWEKEWSHSKNVRLTKLRNDENQIKELFDLFDTRMTIDYTACGDLLRFYSQGILTWGDNYFYADCMDGATRTFDYWIHCDHKGTEIETLDAYRLINGALRAFNYLEENGYVLTRFDDQNFYVGSFSEDRPNFFRTMFYGNKNKNTNVSFANKNKFSPPENESSNIYKSYGYSAGLMTLYAILATNNKKDDFSNSHDKVGDMIKAAAALIYKEGCRKPEHKDFFITFFEDLMAKDVEKRVSAKELLTYKWITECHRLDYEEYQRQLEEIKREKEKEKEEEEKNKFN